MDVLREIPVISIVIIAFALLLLWSLVKLFHYIMLAKASESWPSTNGTILSNELGTSRSDKGRSTHYAKVHYRYNVDGRDYTSRIKGYHMSAAGDFAFVNDNQPGKDIEVFYNPTNPKQATLQTGDSITNYLAIICVLVGLGVCLWMGFK